MCHWCSRGAREELCNINIVLLRPNAHYNEQKSEVFLKQTYLLEGNSRTLSSQDFIKGGDTLI